MGAIMPAVRLDRVSKRFGDHLAVDDLSLEVPVGSVYGFIGPNGSGKTTTLRMILHILLPDSGRIEVLGDSRTAIVRDKIGYLPEERGLYKKMTVRRLLRYYGELKGATRSQVDHEISRWIDQIELRPWLDAKIEALSKGMSQKVQFIAAVVSRPQLVILDEPFSGLDPVAVDALSKVLVGEARRGATVLFSSHQLDLVEDLCERAVIVDRGRAVTSGTIDELTAGADPVLEIDVPSDQDGRWTRDLGEAPVEVVSIRNGRVRMTLREGPGTAADRAAVVLDAARRAGPVNQFSFDRRSLAEVFLGLVGRPADQDTIEVPPEVADVRS